MVLSVFMVLGNYHPHFHFGTLASSPKLNPVPISSPNYPQPPRPWKALISFLILWVCLLQTFLINGIKKYEVFCVWLLSLFSRFIQVVASISTSFLCMMSNIQLYG